jgi:ATP-dependent DNA helicase RecG
MNINQAKRIIKSGENINTEFKESSQRLNKDVFETICAFLNRSGGSVFLGVKDNGKILGLSDNIIGKIKAELVSGINNPQNINPPIYIQPTTIVIEKKSIIHLYVPESSQVHRCNGKIYDRNEDGDFNITNNTTLVANLYNRKQSTFFENEIIPFIKIEHLRADLIQKARQMAVNN